MIRRAGPTDISRLGSLLASAFEADPFTRWLMGTRNASLEPLYRTLVAQSLAHRHVFTDVQGDGVAVWRPAGTPRSIRESLAMLGATVRTTGVARVLRLLPSLLAVDRRHPKGECAELVSLGVAAAARGRGIATRLLRATLADFDAGGTPVALETSNEQNLALYERHGFRVTEVLTLPDGPTVWFMRRRAFEHRRPAGHVRDSSA